MKFIIRDVSGYKDVQVEHDNIKLEVGFLDKDDAKELAIVLIRAADELLQE